MNRNSARRMLDLMLVLSLASVALTGLLIERFDLNEFRPHKLSGYAMTTLVVLHIALHHRWRGPRPSRPVRSRDSPSEPIVPGTPVVAGTPEAQATAGTSGATANSENLQTRALAISERPGRSRRTVLTSLVGGALGAAVGWRARSEVAPNPYEQGDVGLFYHRESSLGVQGLLSGLLDWGRRPPRYKDLAATETVSLPPIASVPVMSVAQAIQQRRSQRTFADRAMTAEELAWMVHAATGITSDGGNRTTPSAGALYPIETYVAVNRIDGIEPGLYHVDVRAQALQLVRAGSVAGDLMVAGLGQDFLRNASAVFVLSGYFQRTRWKYRARHYRYVCWEAGHIAQNLYLAGEAADLGVCVVGAFFDDALNDLLRLDGREEAALGFVAIGPR